jgi:hypothetical protein
MSEVDTVTRATPHLDTWTTAWSEMARDTVCCKRFKAAGKTGHAKPRAAAAMHDQHWSAVQAEISTNAASQE